jgi:tocopherol O-methyltransferase
MLAAEFKVRVTGFTISQAQHAYAENCRFEGDIPPKYFCVDWLEADTTPGMFDAAIACESSEHMEDKGGFFQRAAAALKPGGRLVICAWLASDKASSRQERWLLEPICREGRMPHVGTEGDYRRLGQRAGLNCLRVQDISRNVASTWPRIAWIFLRKLLMDPRYIRFLCNRHARNRVFALTVFRLWIAFRTGAMRYGVFTFVKR